MFILASLLFSSTIVLAWTGKTECQTMGGASNANLDRTRDLSCPDDRPLQGFVMPPANVDDCPDNQRQFKYDCVDNPAKSGTEKTYYTPCKVGAASKIAKLDGHYLYCPVNHVLTSWRLMTVGCQNNYEIKFEYKCKEAVIGKAYELYTAKNHDGYLQYLDRHYPKCGPGMAMTAFGFQLRDNNKYLRFRYSCASMTLNKNPIVKMMGYWKKEFQSNNKIEIDYVESVENWQGETLSQAVTNSYKVEVGVAVTIGKKDGPVSGTISAKVGQTEAEQQIDQVNKMLRKGRKIGRKASCAYSGENELLTIYQWRMTSTLRNGAPGPEMRMPFMLCVRGNVKPVCPYNDCEDKMCTKCLSANAGRRLEMDVPSSDVVGVADAFTMEPNTHVILSYKETADSTTGTFDFDPVDDASVDGSSDSEVSVDGSSDSEGAVAHLIAPAVKDELVASGGR